MFAGDENKAWATLAAIFVDFGMLSGVQRGGRARLGAAASAALFAIMASVRWLLTRTR